MAQGEAALSVPLEEHRPREGTMQRRDRRCLGGPSGESWDAGKLCSWCSRAVSPRQEPPGPTTCSFSGHIAIGSPEPDCTQDNWHPPEDVGVTFLCCLPCPSQFVLILVTVFFILQHISSQLPQILCAVEEELISKLLSPLSSRSHI